MAISDGVAVRAGRQYDPWSMVSLLTVRPPNWPSIQAGLGFSIWIRVGLRESGEIAGRGRHIESEREAAKTGRISRHKVV